MLDPNTTEESPVLIDPFSCRMWECHDRQLEFISEESCREVIASFLKDGQKQPVLARPCRAGDAKYELIYGARRLFASQYLNLKILARVRDIDDRTAFVEMDIENRLRRDISPYERGMSFKAWLRSGHFSCQEDIAKTLGVSAAQVCRLVKFSELATAIVTAFRDPREIRESWAAMLVERCADPQVKKRMLMVARSLEQKGERTIDAKETYKLLLDCSEKTRASRVRGRDEIVRSDDGRPLFRVSYRHNDLHVIIKRELAPARAVHELTEALKRVLVLSERDQKVASEAGWRQSRPCEALGPVRARTVAHHGPSEDKGLRASSAQ